MHYKYFVINNAADWQIVPHITEQAHHVDALTLAEELLWKRTEEGGRTEREGSGEERGMGLRAREGGSVWEDGRGGDGRVDGGIGRDRRQWEGGGKRRVGKGYSRA